MAHNVDAAVYRAAQSQFYAPSPNEKDDTFILKNGLELCVTSGDITTVKASVVVVGEDAQLSGGGAVAERLIKVGGREYRENRELLKVHMRETGYRSDVYSCVAGPRLNFHQVFHALTTHRGGKSGITCWDAHMKNLFFQIAILAENNKADTVATPLLGAGAAGGSLDESLEALVDGLQCVSSKIFRKVILVEYDSKKASEMKEKLRQILDRKRKEAEEAAERAEQSRGSRIPGPGPFKASAAGSTGAKEDWNDLQSFDETSGQEAWPSNRVTEDRRRSGANHSGHSNLDLFNSTNNNRSRHEDHRYRVDSRAGAEGSNEAETPKEKHFKVNPKIINAITDTTRPIESRSQDSSPGIQTETFYRDDGWRRNDISSRTSSTTGERTPVGEVTQQGGRHATNSCFGNAFKSADSSGNMNSSSRQPDPDFEGKVEGGVGFLQDKGSFQENEEIGNEREDKDDLSNVTSSIPKDGQNGRDEGKIDGSRSSSSKDGLIKCGTPPKIVYATSKDDEGEGKDEDERRDEDKDEDEDAEISPASRDRGGRGYGKDDKDKDYKESVINYPSPSPQTAQPKVMMWSSSQMSDVADSNVAPSDTSASLPSSDADHSNHPSQDSQSRHGNLTTATSAEDENSPRDGGSFSNSQDSFQPKRTPEKASEQSFGQRRDETESAAREDDAFKQEAQARASEKPRGERREPGPESVGGGTHAEGKINTDVKPRLQLDGFPDCGTILIEYSFPNGVQGPQHPAPGQPYKGTFRRAFLPDNLEGRRVLQLLEKAFHRKLTFQLQRTGPGQEWGVEFADIPHKTSLRGGPEGNGYPDEAYLARVLEKLEYLDQP